MTKGRCFALVIAAVLLVGLIVANELIWHEVLELVDDINERSEGELFRRISQVVPVSMVIARYAGEGASAFTILSIAAIAARVRLGLSIGYFAALVQGVSMCATLFIWFNAYEVGSHIVLVSPASIPYYFIMSLVTQLATLLLITWSLQEAKTLLNDLEDRDGVNINSTA